MAEQLVIDFPKENVMTDYFKRVAEKTKTKFWINNVTEEEANLALEAGAFGCTQNPSYSYKMMTHPTQSGRSMEILREVLKEEKDDNKALIRYQRTMVGKIAKIFYKQYKESNGEFGYVSIQGDPFDESFDTIMNLAHFNREAGDNIMIKIPATKEGIQAIEQCVSEGIPVNCTEVMSMQQVIDVMDACDRGLKRGCGKTPMIYISHITGIFDEYINNYVKKENVDISSDAVYLASKALGQKIRYYMDIRKTPIRLINGGARGLNHFTEWVGCDVSCTINWLGTADKLLEQNPHVVPCFNNPVPFDVVDELVNKIPAFEQAYFTGRLKPEEYHDFGPVELFCSSFRKAWTQALAIIKEERTK